MKIWKNFYAQEKQLDGHFFLFYNIVDAVANNAYILLRKAGEYKPSKKAFLKKTDF